MVDVVRPMRVADLAEVRFEVAPSYDLLISLAAAGSPERYEMPEAWARDVRQALPAPLRRELHFFFGGPIGLGAEPIQYVPEIPDGEKPARFVAGLQALDRSDLIAAILWRRSAGQDVLSALKRKLRG